ncbi:hypothetical protein Hypma_000592 [Hypsizygus marmoreus]|uniref:Thioredoxin-like protein n=1 Tax=Hypsizygus marmoreus TaxID=39966 RepID=A0A369JCL4_HYPMA|nr:hypothetical protein Hypma_000592 [Hypsizygus marmoreus]
MFNSFKRSLPEISIFHLPTSAPSTKALALLRSSLSGPYPPTNPKKPPLEFTLSVVEDVPTPDQLTTILSYLPSKTASPASAFISAHWPDERPDNVKGIATLAKEHPGALRWPIVVDWADGQAAVGDVEGVKGILETLRKKRDGEAKEEEVYKPKGWFS